MLYNLLQSTDQWLDEVGLFRLVQVMYQLEFRAFFAVVLSFALVLIGGKRTIRWLLKQRIGDAPEFYNQDLNKLMASKAHTPTMGGLLICGAIGVTTLLFADLREAYVWLAIVVLVWLAVVGGFDDWLKLTSGRRNPGMREGLYAWEKLLFQLGIGFIAGFFLFRYGAEQIDARVLTLPFQRTYAPGTLQLDAGVLVLGIVPFVLIAVVLIAGTSNAVNLTDGMDGLSAGTMLVASFAMMVLCYVAGSEDAARTLMFPYIAGAKELMVVTGAMAGACLGFLWFNCAPAQVFMGDTGSLPLGGLLAYTAVAIRQEFLLIVIGGVFFMEMASVIMQVGYFKATGGNRIFRCSPIHHHFHLGGWSEQQVVTRFWVLAVACAMVALVSLKLR
ncbi:MAG: phospho-N-acetylmuramoyl-pentapeptide-transferase [Phycisphaerales bacterium]|nr:phospho-N-acetylmuramoyl-pentapeptide-transferase [Phycisphaerae bacterium]NNF41660.1 phospho-N-acetylmuramoyl-pentapeptide-transferase [Phycisphaerales bacterium]NNM27618.1 phospho-N-acetylmuramoyl-pentapeptide-transferase [Phycisphaerales bacterium]